VKKKRGGGSQENPTTSEKSERKKLRGEKGDQKEKLQNWQAPEDYEKEGRSAKEEGGGGLEKRKTRVARLPGKELDRKEEGTSQKKREFGKGEKQH